MNNREVTVDLTQVPPEIADVVAKWEMTVGDIAAVDEQLADRDARIKEFSETLRELNASHRTLGMQRTELVKSAERLRVMAEHGCRHEGIPMPPQIAQLVPAPGAPAEPPPSVSTGPAAAIDNALNSGPLAVLGDPTDTRVDDPDGGDEPASGRFHRGHGRGR